MADCEGISIAFSFKLCTYFIRSTTGIRIFKPWSIPKVKVQSATSQFKVQSAILTGSSVLRYFPNRSTIHACCCGTKLITWRTSGEVEWNRRKCTRASLEPGLSTWLFVLKLLKVGSQTESQILTLTHTHTHVGGLGDRVLLSWQHFNVYNCHLIHLKHDLLHWLVPRKPFTHSTGNNS